MDVWRMVKWVLWNMLSRFHIDWGLLLCSIVYMLLIYIKIFVSNVIPQAYCNIPQTYFKNIRKCNKMWFRKRIATSRKRTFRNIRTCNIFPQMSYRNRNTFYRKRNVPACITTLDISQAYTYEKCKIYKLRLHMLNNGGQKFFISFLFCVMSAQICSPRLDLFF